MGGERCPLPLASKARSKTALAVGLRGLQYTSSSPARLDTCVRIHQGFVAPPRSSTYIVYIARESTAESFPVTGRIDELRGRWLREICLGKTPNDLSLRNLLTGDEQVCVGEAITMSITSGLCG